MTGAPLARCPMRELLEADPALLDEVDRHQRTYYPLYKAGHLAVPGGVDAQPQRWWDYMQALDASERALEAAALSLSEGA